MCGNVARNCDPLSGTTFEVPSQEMLWMRKQCRTLGTPWLSRMEKRGLFVPFPWEWARAEITKEKAEGVARVMMVENTRLVPETPPTLPIV